MLDETLLRRLFDQAVTRSGAFGAQLSIIRADQQLDFAAGVAHATRGQAMTTDTLMQIGSITKVFNSTIAHSLVEEGLLDLDAPVQHYLPHFQTANPRFSRSLRVRHLLSMSSGLDNGPYAYLGPEADALERYVASLQSLPHHFPPGEHFGYSNAGTCIAGYISSRLAGKPWETLLWERVLRPAGLQAVVLDEDLRDQVVSAGHEGSSGENPPSGSQPNENQPSEKQPGVVAKIVEPAFAALRSRAPSGPSLAMSIGHLARFAKLFFNEGRADTGAQILRASSVKSMMSPQIRTPMHKYGDSWCVGPCSGDWNGVRVWGHGGTSLTASALLYWIPEHKGVIAFASNTHAAMGEFSRMALEDILQAAFGFSKPPIDVPAPHLPALDIRRYAGRYEAVGMRLEVTEGEDSTLRAAWVPTIVPAERGVGRNEQQASLVPLGGDRFLVKPVGGPSAHRGVVDMAFFGDDGTGRATNALDMVFPMSRVEEGASLAGMERQAT